MKPEDEKFKEIFTDNLGRQKDIPDFELMWQAAAEAHKKNSISAWRIAASILLIIGGIVILEHRTDSTQNATLVTTWSEPTEALLPSRQEVQLTAVSQWTSPTRTLLPQNEYVNK